MGLLDRIQEFQTQRAREELIRLAAKAKIAAEGAAQANAETIARAEAIKKVARGEEERKTALAMTLTPVLGLVDARTQLSAIKYLWRVGEIDQTPAITTDSRVGEGLGLGLRYRFADTARLMGVLDPVSGMDGENGQRFFIGDQIFDREVALIVMATLNNDAPQITTLYSDSFSRYPQMRGYYTKSTYDRVEQEVTFKSYQYFRTDRIDLGDRSGSVNALEDQLFAFYSGSGIPNPMAQASEARRRVQSAR